MVVTPSDGELGLIVVFVSSLTDCPVGQEALGGRGAEGRHQEPFQH